MTAKKKPVDNSSERGPKPAGAPRAGAGRPPPPPKLTPRARETEALAARFPRYRMVKTDELLPFTNNSRTHSDASVAKLVRSIQEFGFTNPILTDGDSGIIAGHGRFLAAQQLGMETVPTIELKHLSEAQKRAYVMADNRLALDAGYDDDLLRLEMGDLREMGFDLDLTGFDAAEVDKLFADDPADEAGGGGARGTDGGKVCCPKCGLEFQTRSRTFREIVAKSAPAIAQEPDNPLLGTE